MQHGHDLTVTHGTEQAAKNKASILSIWKTSPLRLSNRLPAQSQVRLLFRQKRFAELSVQT